METGQTKSKPKRHPSAPLPSRLKPAQYARLISLIGSTPDSTNELYVKTRKLLGKFGHGAFSVDDLIDEALRRLFLGDLPRGMKFPLNTIELYAAIQRLGELHFRNARRADQRKGSRPITFEGLLESIEADVPLHSLSTLQLDLLNRLEAKLVERIHQISSPEKPTCSEISSEVELC